MEHGPQVQKLIKRMEDMGVKNFSVFKGPEWYNTPPEDRAKAMNDAFDAIDSGDVMEIPDGHLDGPPWFPMPQCPMSDIRDNTWRYKRHQWLQWLHGFAYKFDHWYLWKKHKVKRFFLGNYHARNKKSL